MKKFDTYVKEAKNILTPSTEEAQITIDNIRKIVCDYVKTNRLESLIIGVSGGLDSAVVSALCQEKYTGVPLIGISIPMNSTNKHKEQAQWVGKEYCTVFEEFRGWEELIDINQNYDTNTITQICETTSMTNTLAQKAGFKVQNFPTNILNGNIKARIRMITLYDLARKTNGMVLSTDNLSEYLMGFWTINGDVGDYGPIQNIGKGFELPKIAEVLGIRTDIITQPPSDGLMVTEDNTDEAQLGASYQEVDAIMFPYLRIKQTSLNLNEVSNTDKIEKVISRYKTLSYKRNGTINLTRKEIGIK